MFFVSQLKQLRKGFGLGLRLNDILYELIVHFGARYKKGSLKIPKRVKLLSDSCKAFRETSTLMQLL